MILRDSAPLTDERRADERPAPPAHKKNAAELLPLRFCGAHAANRRHII